MAGIVETPSRYDSGGAGVTLGGPGAEKLLVIIPISRSNSFETSLTVDVGGVAAVEHDSFINLKSSKKTQSGIFYILGANIPSGSTVITNTWDGVEDNSQGIIFEIDVANQSGPLSAASIVLSTVTEASPASLAATLAGQSGKLGIAFGMMAENSYMNDGGFITSTEGHPLIAKTKEVGVNTYAKLAVYSDASIATDSETYTFSHSLRGGALDVESMIVGAFAVNPPVVNIPPVLDTPNNDISVGTDSTDAIDIAPGFSDANSDTLTFSVAPAFPSGVVLTSAGLITLPGPLSVYAATDHTITADDGKGGTITDVISFEITPPVFSVGVVSNSAPRAGESFTVAITNPAATVTASAPSGVLAIDSQTSTELTFTTPHPMAHGDKSLNFESAITITVADGTTVRTFDIQIQVETGYVFGAITAPSPLGFYKDDGPGVADPSWLTIMTGLSVYGQSLTGDFLPELSTGRGTNTLLSTFRYALYDGVWSPFSTETFNARVNQAPTVTAPDNVTIEFANGSSGLAKNDATLVALIDAATVSDDVDTLTLNDVLSGLADPIPAGVYTLTFTATDSGGLSDSDTMQLTVVEATSSALTKKAKITGFESVAGDLVTHLFEYYVLSDSDLYPTMWAGGTFNAVDRGENFQMTAGGGEVLAPNSAVSGSYKLIAYDTDETFVIHADVTIVEE